ncbi:hypothetical protein ALC53_06047 [Atta colombica]|uniref:Uncharacterized protein n=1 Tax=Atta colombica TaxID=520822 RepID=A0A195BGA4_9HYME|nr:hypothetical protein ALC53_06047 [Atta colombica]
MTGSKGYAATGERERERGRSGRDGRALKERKRGLDDDDDSGVNTARSSGQSATKAPKEKSHLSLLRLFSRPLVPLFRWEARARVWVHRIRSSGGGGVGVRIGRKEVGDGTRDTSLGREREGQREWGMHGLPSYLRAPPSPHPVNVDIHHKSIHTVSDRDEENTHPAQGVAARSQKRRAFIFCPFELVMFRSNGDITMEWEPIANRSTLRCLVFASLVKIRLRRSCAVE